MALGDAATWVSVIAGSLLTGAGVDFAYRSWRENRRAADAGERQAVAAEKSVPPPPPNVAWRIEHRESTEYFLRNVGAKPATGVRISAGNRVTLGLKLSGSADRPICPEDARTFVMVVPYGTSAPGALLLSWDDNPEGDWVALPSRK